MVSIKLYLSSFDRAVGGHQTETSVVSSSACCVITTHHNSQPLCKNSLRINTTVFLQSLY